MDPYTPPTAEQDAAYEADATPGEGMEGHRLYAMVEKMVLVGGKQEDVYHRLEVNAVTGTTADLLYAHARGVRLALIRGSGQRKALQGSGLLLAGVATFLIFWYGLHFIPRILAAACAIAVGIGAWKLIDGTAGFLMAGSRSGSVFEDH